MFCGFSKWFWLLIDGCCCDRYSKKPSLWSKLCAFWQTFLFTAVFTNPPYTIHIVFQKAIRYFVTVSNSNPFFSSWNSISVCEKERIIRRVQILFTKCKKNSVRQNLLTQTICGSARCFSRRATESAKLRQNELSMWSAFHHKIYFSYILSLFITFNLTGRHMKKLFRKTSNAFLQWTWCVSIHDILTDSAGIVFGLTVRLRTFNSCKTLLCKRLNPAI